MSKTENINLSLSSDNIITIILLSILAFLILKLNPMLLSKLNSILPKLCNYLNSNDMDNQ